MTKLVQLFLTTVALALTRFGKHVPVSAFQLTTTSKHAYGIGTNIQRQKKMGQNFFYQIATAISLSSSLQNDPGDSSEIEQYLAETYPAFYDLLLKNAEDVLKELRKPDIVFTIFAPSDRVFEEVLTDKQIEQLRDPRNVETTSKIAAFHCVVDDAEMVTAEVILDENSNIGGILTLAGEVPVGPSQSGGFFGVGAKPDGGVVVGPNARIVQSLQGPRGVVHEVDALVSPNLVWRYMDQLGMIRTS